MVVFARYDGVRRSIALRVLLFTLSGAVANVKRADSRRTAIHCKQMRPRVVLQSPKREGDKGAAFISQGKGRGGNVEVEGISQVKEVT